jgi:hypothetical protein
MIKTSRAVCAFLQLVVSHTLGRLLCVAIVAFACAPSTYAAVTSIGDVLPIDKQNTSQIEGLPPAGNEYNDDADPDMQDEWESNDVIPGYEAFDAGIVVGQKLPQGGRLDIDSNSILRYQTMIIGDEGTVNGVIRKGTGRVLITGIEAMFSNMPTFPDALDPSLPDGFAVLPEDLREPDVGFDLFVGRAGVGTLDILAGGRAEIQDAVIIGDQLGSLGKLKVDGFASLLVSGGYLSGDALDADPHQMIIGRRGRGELTISNRGIVVSEAPPSSSNTQATVGAVIGSDRFDEDIPELGGEGVVTVDGFGPEGIVGATWIIGGSLQVGSFHDAQEGLLGDFDGDTVQYTSEAGQGDLYVKNGGLVQLRNAIDADPEQDELLMVIGRFGRVILDNGTIDLGAGLEDGGREDNIQVLNDGVISGTGRINTGVFNNRYRGEVRVDAGQSLIINATSEVVNPQDLPPAVNFGVMRILGTVDQPAYFEFERAPDAPTEAGQPFRNLRVTRPVGSSPTETFGGLISAQHSRMIFRTASGNEDPIQARLPALENSSMIAFTAGMNYVVGNVLNLPGPVMPLVDPGIVRISGPGTRVIFENDFVNAGDLQLAGGGTFEVLQRHSFVTSGNLDITLGPNFPMPAITTAGDVGIAGKLTVRLSGFTPGSLALGSTFEIISASGQLGGVDISDPLHPLPDLTKAPLFTTLDFPNLTSFGLPADAVFQPIYLSDSVLLTVFSTIGFIGADFNGDNFVDFDDLEIWKDNKGITMGATILQGDANHDGRVDGTDYLLWFSQFNMPPTPIPGAGGGSGGGSGSGFVPEPCSLVMLSMASMLAMVYRRRRA